MLPIHGIEGGKEIIDSVMTKRSNPINLDYAIKTRMLGNIKKNNTVHVSSSMDAGKIII
jgi:hypothetical protein